MNWIIARSKLAQAKNRANGKPIAHNTRLFDRDNEAVGLRLHYTEVVTFHKDDSITLNSGGWRTITTKDRMNYAVSVWQKDWKWFVEWHGRQYDFADGMRLFPNGTVKYLKN